MSWAAIVWVSEKTAAKRTDQLVLFRIAYHHNRNTGQCNPSVDLLAEETGYDRVTVMRSIQRLEDAGVLVVERDKRGGRSRVNRYSFPGLQMVSQSNHSARRNGDSASRNGGFPSVNGCAAQPEPYEPDEPRCAACHGTGWSELPTGLVDLCDCRKAS